MRSPGVINSKSRMACAASARIARPGAASSVIAGEVGDGMSADDRSADGTSTEGTPAAASPERGESMLTKLLTTLLTGLMRQVRLEFADRRGLPRPHPPGKCANLPAGR